MNISPTRITTVALVAALLAANTAGVLYVSESMEQERMVFESKLSLLNQQLALLERELNKVSGENSEISVSLEELQTGKTAPNEVLVDAVARVVPSVVSVVVTKDVPKLEVVYVNPFGNDPFFRDFDMRIPTYRQKGTEERKVGAGTGIAITKDGHIVTNRHVVDDPQAHYTALLSDGTQKPARVVYKDPVHDVAIIKIDGVSTPVASLGDSDSLQLGQTVAAIGNALGEYNNSVSVGIISGLDRTLTARTRTGEIVELTDIIQTDAAINPGNSGGPLITTGGEVVGINVATVIGSNDIGFAIPISTVKTIIHNVI